MRFVGDAEACAVQERVAALEPLSPLFQYRLMYNLWSAGRVNEADRAIDRAIELWPFHPGVWSARIWLNAKQYGSEEGSLLPPFPGTADIPPVESDGLTTGAGFGRLLRRNGTG